MPSKLLPGRQQNHEPLQSLPARAGDRLGRARPGVLHAPGSLCTYEPQFASDVYAMYQSLTDDRPVPEELLWKDCPPEKRGDVDYLIEVIDWELNVDPDFAAHRFMRPVPVKNPVPGSSEKWICYRSDAVSAKELTVLPGAEAVIRDEAAYGLIMMQGYGTLNGMPLETPAMIRFGEQTCDEYFVSEAAARRGVRIRNRSHAEPARHAQTFRPGKPGVADRLSAGPVTSRTPETRMFNV